VVIGRDYLLKKPVRPSAPKLFLDTRVVPLAVNIAGGIGSDFGSSLGAHGHPARRHLHRRHGRGILRPVLPAAQPKQVGALMNMP
jgi:hypothetical protein